MLGKKIKYKNRVYRLWKIEDDPEKGIFYYFITETNMIKEVVFSEVDFKNLKKQGVIIDLGRKINEHQ